MSLYALDAQRFVPQYYERQGRYSYADLGTTHLMFLLPAGSIRAVRGWTLVHDRTVELPISTGVIPYRLQVFRNSGITPSFALDAAGRANPPGANPSELMAENTTVSELQRIDTPWIRFVSFGLRNANATLEGLSASMAQQSYYHSVVLVNGATCTSAADAFTLIAPYFGSGRGRPGVYGRWIRQVEGPPASPMVSCPGDGVRFSLYTDVSRP
jgi:hypothetical protein